LGGNRKGTKNEERTEITDASMALVTVIRPARMWPGGSNQVGWFGKFMIRRGRSIGRIQGKRADYRRERGLAKLT